MKLAQTKAKEGMQILATIRFRFSMSDPQTQTQSSIVPGCHFSSPKSDSEAKLVMLPGVKTQVFFKPVLYQLQCSILGPDTTLQALQCTSAHSLWACLWICHRQATGNTSIQTWSWEHTTVMLNAADWKFGLKSLHSHCLTHILWLSSAPEILKTCCD